MALAVSNLDRPSSLGSMVSPYSLLVIPTFEVILKNAGVTKTAKVGFDTGLEGVHLQMPASLARSMGISSYGADLRADATKTFFASLGRMESISVPGSPGCRVDNAKVLFYENAPLLIGNQFMNDSSSKISYSKGSPSIECDESQTPKSGRVLPIFPIYIIEDGVSREMNAFFDTGWEGADIAIPQSLAGQLGLPILDTLKARAHTGIVTLGISKLDRLGLKGLPSCYVNEAVVHVLPPESPIRQIIVGEEFLKKTSGVIGYDSQGPYFTCGKAGGASVRAVGQGFLPYTIETIGANPWLLGLAGVLGVLGVTAIVTTLVASPPGKR